MKKAEIQEKWGIPFVMGDGYSLILLLSYIGVLIAVIEHSPNTELNQKPILPSHSRGENGIHHGQTMCCTFFLAK